MRRHRRYPHIKAIITTSLLALWLVVMSACSDRPDGVPDKDKMADVLADMHRLEAYWALTDGPVSEGNDSVRKVMRQQMLKKHGMTEQQWEMSLKYYAHHIDDYVEVYDKVEKRLQKDMEDASKRNDNITKTGQMTIADGDNLWTGNPLYVLRYGTGKDGIAFDMTPPATLHRGDLLRWQMGSTARRSDARMMLGVDYEDGSTAYMIRKILPKDPQGMYVNLQTDSTLSVKRIYGVLNYEIERGEVVMLDSIAMSRHPLDRRQYVQINSQQRYNGNGDIRRSSKAKPAAEQTAVPMPVQDPSTMQVPIAPSPRIDNR